MTEVKERLFEAFRQDHAILGRGLYDLRQEILKGDVAAVRQAAWRLDRDAGPHIAFEERDFYPALKRFLSQAEVDEMFRDHAEGLAVLRELMALGEEDLEDEQRRAALVERIEAMEAHVSECGELFGAMGGLEPLEMERLLGDLEKWREAAPHWTDQAGAPDP